MANTIEELAVALVATTQKFGKDIDAAIGKAKTELAVVEKPVALKANTSSFVSAIKSAASTASGALSAVGNAAAGALKMLGTVGLAVSGFEAITGAVKGLGQALGLGLASEFENVEAQMLAFTKDGAKAKEILAEIRAEADKTPFSFEAMAKATASLMPAAKQANEPLMELVKTAEILAASNPQQGLEGAAFALREAVSGDFTSIIERFNLPRQYINQLKDQGIPALEAVRMAMLEMGYDADLVSNLAKTGTGRWSTLMDTFDGIRMKLSQPLFEKWKEGLAKAQEWLDANKDAIDRFANVLGAGLVAAVDNGVAALEALGQVIGPIANDFRNFMTILVGGDARDVAAAFESLPAPLAAVASILDDITHGLDFANLAADIEKVTGLDITAFAGVFNHAADGAGRFAEILTQLGSAVGSAIGPAVETILPNLVSIWNELTAAFAEGTPLMTSLNELLTELGPVLEFVGMIIGAIVVGNLGLWLGALGAVVGFIKGALPGALQWLAGALEYVSGVIQVVTAIVTGVINIVGDLLKGDWTAAWNHAGEMVEGVIEGVKTMVEGGVKAVVGLFGGLAGGVLGALQGFWDATTAFFKKLYDELVGHSIIPDLIQAIIDIFTGLPGRLAGALASIASTILDSITGNNGWSGKVRTAVSELITTLVGFFASLPGLLNEKLSAIASKALEIGTSIKDGIVNGIKGTAGAIGNLYDALLGALKSLINSAIDAINDAIPNDIGFDVLGNWVGIDLPDNPIPHLAKGIRDFAGGLAVVGEEGPELVGLPRGANVYSSNLLDKLAIALSSLPGSALVSNLAGQGSSLTQNFTMNVNSNAGVSTVISDFSLLKALAEG